LLGAISLQPIGLGISLVLCFSVGLAIVLSGLGLLLVSAKKWFQKFPISPKNQIALPIVSASVITIIGLISTATAIHNIIC